MLKLKMINVYFIEANSGLCSFSLTLNVSIKSGDFERRSGMGLKLSCIISSTVLLESKDNFPHYKSVGQHKQKVGKNPQNEGKCY